MFQDTTLPVVPLSPTPVGLSEQEEASKWLRLVGLGRWSWSEHKRRA